MKKPYLITYSVILFSLLTSLPITPYVNAQLLPTTVEPSPPTGLTANLVSPSKINLSWTAPSGPTSSLLTGYKIERSTDGGNTWSTLVGNTGNTSTTYTDSALGSGTTYTYRVSAINPVGTSPPSNTASATTTSISWFVAFQTCCWGDLKINVQTANPVPGVDQVQLTIYAPNGNIVVNTMEPTFFEYNYLISRSDGKGNYVVVVTYDNDLVKKGVVGSWINNDPVVTFGIVTEGSDHGVFINGQVENGIGGEQVSLVVLDPNKSQRASYTLTTTPHAIFEIGIDPASAATVFPASGNYTIVATHIPTGVTAQTVLSYTR